MPRELLIGLGLVLVSGAFLAVLAQRQRSTGAGGIALVVVLLAVLAAADAVLWILLLSG